MKSKKGGVSNGRVAPQIGIMGESLGSFGEDINSLSTGTVTNVATTETRRSSETRSKQLEKADGCQVNNKKDRKRYRGAGVL